MSKKPTQISYAHRDAPGGMRIVGDAGAEVPPWAVDVRPHVGMEAHPTDALLSGGEAAAEVEALRSAHDRIAKAGLLAELGLLMAAAKSKEAADQAEMAAGEDI